jgi:hypothetical protein
MGMGKIKALKIRSIGFFAPDFLHVAFLGFSAKKRLRQKLKVMSEILSVPASRNNFAKKDRIDYVSQYFNPLFGGYFYPIANFYGASKNYRYPPKKAHKPIFHGDSDTGGGKS